MEQSPPKGIFSNGPVPDDALYINRDADEDLFEALTRGEPVHLLAPPRSGKSSLRLRVIQRLTARGVRCATIDLQRMSHRVSVEGFAYALVGQLAENLRLPDPTGFFVKYEALTPPQRFDTYLREEVLTATSTPVVVFIDEIDALQALRTGAEDFAAVLSGLMEDRQQDAGLRRLNFCLIGSQPPESLLSPRASMASLPPPPSASGDASPRRTPFPLARVIELFDFTASEAGALLAPVAQSIDGDASALLRRVLHWTDGHPHMTLRLCQAVTRERRSFATSEEEHVDKLVQKLLVAQSGADPSLSAASRRFTTASDTLRLSCLSLYRRLLFKERVPSRRSGNSPVEEADIQRAAEALRLMGMIKEYLDESGVRWLRVRNRVFEEAFGPAWIEEKGQGRVLTDMLTRWLRSGKRLDFLLRGKELDEVLGWSSLGQPKTPDEEEFLRAALALRQEEELRVTKEALEAENRMRLHARQQQRRERGVLIGLLLATALTGVVATLTLTGRLRGAERDATYARKQAWERYTEADVAQGQRERAAQLSAYALRRLVHAAQPALRRGDGTASDPAVVEARRLLAAVLADGDQGRANEQIDGLYAAALAQQAEGRMDALVASARAVAAALRRGPTGLDKSVPMVLAGQGLVAAVSESLAQPPAGAGAAPLLPILRGHGGYVRGAQFSPDGQQILTLSDDRTARLWEARSGKPLATLSGHSGILNAAVFSPDGALVVTASNDHTARLFRVADGRTVALLAGHSADVRAATFAPDSKRVATASGDGTVRLWDSGGRLLQVLRAHGKDAVTAVFAPDGQRVLSASLDGTARLWDVQTGAAQGTLSGHEGPVLAAAFSPDGQRIATASGDHSARLWDGAGQALRMLQGHAEAVTAVSFAPDGKTLLTASTDRTARLWDVESGAARAALTGHSGAVQTAAFSPDGTLVLTASTDRTARLWTLGGLSLGVLRGHALPVSAAVFSPDGQWALTTSGDRTARLFPATLARFLEIACRLLAEQPEAEQVRDACPAK